MVNRGAVLRQSPLCDVLKEGEKSRLHDFLRVISLNLGGKCITVKNHNLSVVHCCEGGGMSFTASVVYMTVSAW